MAESQSQVSNYNFAWDLTLQPAAYGQSLSTKILVQDGVLAGKYLALSLKVAVDGWFNPRYDLRVPTYPDVKFHIPEAKVQLISGSEIKREFPITFDGPSSVSGVEQEILHGRMSDMGSSPQLLQGTYIVRLLFTLELEKSIPIPDVIVLDNDDDVMEKSAILELLFRTAADVKIVCGREEFLAHKSLLAEKSPVFRQMFESEMTESLTGKLVLDEKEIAPSSVLQFLRFLYTGKMKESKEVCKDLFITAEKYDMQGLKARCENYLARILTPKNAVEFYDLAETHHGELLKTKVVQLLKLHKSKLFPNADALHDFGHKYPQLMFQLFMK